MRKSSPANADCRTQPQVLFNSRKTTSNVAAVSSFKIHHPRPGAPSYIGDSTSKTTDFPVRMQTRTQRDTTSETTEIPARMKNLVSKNLIRNQWIPIRKTNCKMTVSNFLKGNL